MADQDLLTAGSAKNEAAAPGGTRPPTPATPEAVPDSASVSPPARRRRWVGLGVFVLLLRGAGAGVAWWLDRPPGLPPGIATSNGRLEADEIDVDTKFSGRISEILADEGTMVKAGQVVAPEYSPTSSR